jgi:hypothetical protein
MSIELRGDSLGCNGIWLSADAGPSEQIREFTFTSCPAVFG